MRSNRPFKRPWWAVVTVTAAGVVAAWLALQPIERLQWFPWFEGAIIVLGRLGLVTMVALALMALWWDLIERFAFYARVSNITIAEAYRKRYGQQQDQEEAP